MTAFIRMINAADSTIGPLLIRLVIACLALGVASCERTTGQPELPPIPQPGIEKSTPVVRAQIERALEAAFENPTRAEVIGKLAMTLHAYLYFNEAEVAYRRARLLAPREARWAYLHGRVLDNQGRAELAEAALRVAVAADGSYVPAQLTLARNLDIAGKSEEARRILAQVVEKQPDNPTARYQLGVVLNSAGEFEAATSELERALELAGPFDTGFYALANAYRAQGRSNDAAAALADYSRHRGTSLTSRDPHMAAVRALDQSNQALLRRAKDSYAGGRIEEAIRLLDTAIANEPRDAVAHATLLALYGETGRYDKVDEHYEIALAIDPDLAELHYNLGQARSHENRNVEAIAAFRKALELNPYSPDIHTRIGLVYADQGKDEEAIEAYRTALTVAPDYAPAHRLLAQSHYDARRFSEASEALERLSALPGERTIDVLRRLARCYREMGDAKAAMNALRGALELVDRGSEGRVATAIEREMARIEKMASDSSQEKP